MSSSGREEGRRRRPKRNPLKTIQKPPNTSRLRTRRVEKGRQRPRDAARSPRARAPTRGCSRPRGLRSHLMRFVAVDRNMTIAVLFARTSPKVRVVSINGSPSIEAAGQSSDGGTAV